MHVQHFFESETGSLTYVVHDDETAVVIDPVMDYNPANGRTSDASALIVAAYIDDHHLAVPYVIDTHAHADHATAIPFFKQRYQAKSVTGAQVGQIQAHFKKIYNLPETFPTDGSQFDRLIDEGDELTFGSLSVRAIHTPGHTPAHMSWQIGDAIFVGDTLFMPDYGSARCDFPGGSAAALYESIQRLYAFPDATRLFMCHDYQPGGRDLEFETTVGEQKSSNVQIDANTTKEDYIAFRAEKDEALPAPRLILPSLQINIRAGELPPAESNGTRYLKIPLNVLGSA